MSGLEETIDELWALRQAGAPSLGAELENSTEAIDLLDSGERRIAEVVDGGVVVHEWLKRAILLYFASAANVASEVGPFEIVDKVRLKSGLARAGVRVLPGAIARWSSFIEAGAVLMPSFVNIGAWVGAGTMVDTWATIGSCAQVGRRQEILARQGRRVEPWMAAVALLPGSTTNTGYWVGSVRRL